MTDEATTTGGRMGVDGADPSSALWRLARDVVALVDRDGNVARVSPSVERSYGHRPAALVGRPVLDLIHPERRVALEACMAQPDLADPTDTTTLPVRSADGSWRTSLVWMDQWGTDANEVGLALGLRPIDEGLARVHARERAAIERLQLVDEMKHRLLEAVSHELRTPLTVIGGFAEVLQRHGDQLERERLAQIGDSIGRQAVRLERSVTDLMDLDRVSRGTLLLELERVDLAETVIEVAEQVPIGHRELHLDVHSTTAVVDRAKFQRIVECLLVNARRHTPEGTRIWLRLGTEGDGALLEVSDDGPGLSDELKREIFSPFVQGSLLDPENPGLGLGLALARRFAELHGGRCWVADGEEGGAAFAVFLPDGLPTALDREALDAKLRDARAHEAAADEHRSRDIEVRPEALAVVRSMLSTVRRELGMRVAYLSAFLSDEQVVLAVDGDGEPVGVRPGGRFPLDETYCVRMVRGEIGNLVVDTSREPILANLPSTAEGLACYAGVPVRLPNGQIFGSLCCADTEPRPELQPSQVAVLQTVAELVGGQLAQGQLVSEADRDARRRIEELLARPDRLTAVYQPIVELRTGVVAGVEALSRFSDHHVRPPDIWFGEAQRVGLGGELEQVAMHRALAGLNYLDGSQYLSINVSPDTIVAGGLRPLLGRVPLERILVEITEHAVVEDYDLLSACLRPFRRGGARLAIDDVGSGFANLRHVLQLSPDVIKVDRSLVHEVSTDPAQRAITVALADLGRRLGAQLVAEGVEDAATLGILIESGISYAQGWLFDAPGGLPTRPSYEIPTASGPPPA